MLNQSQRTILDVFIKEFKDEDNITTCKREILELINGLGLDKRNLQRRNRLLIKKLRGLQT